MTETLQDKIDNILRDTISEHWQAVMINKAIQELREEIKSMPMPYMEYIKKEDVLALIGEK